MTYYNIVNQEWSQEYLDKHSVKPYTKILILPSGIYATYGPLNVKKDKLNVTEINIAEDNLERKGISPIIQIFTGKRCDLEGDVTFRFCCDNGLSLLTTLSSLVEIHALCKYIDTHYKEPTYKDWVKSQRTM